MKRKILLIALSSTMSIVPLVSLYSVTQRDNKLNIMKQESKLLASEDQLKTLTNSYHVFGLQDEELSWGVRYKEMTLSSELKTTQDISLFERDEENNILVDNLNNPVRLQKTELGYRFASLDLAQRYISRYLSDVNEFNSLYPDNKIEVNNDELNESLLRFKYSTDSSEAAFKRGFYEIYNILKDSSLEEISLIEKQNNLSWTIRYDMINYLYKNSEKPLISNTTFRTADELDEYLSTDKIKIPGSIRRYSLPYYLKSLKISDRLVYENNQNFNEEVKDKRIHRVEYTIKNISRMSAGWGSVEILNNNDMSTIAIKGSTSIGPAQKATYSFELPADSNFNLSEVTLKWNTRADFGSTAMESAVAYNEAGEILGKVIYGAVRSSNFKFVKYNTSKDSEFIFNKEEYYNVSKIQFGIQNPTRSSWGGRWSFRITDKETGTKIWNAPTVYLAPNTTQTFTYDLKDTNAKGLNIKNAILDWFPRYDFANATKLLSVILYDENDNEISRLEHNSPLEFHKEMAGFIDVNNATQTDRERASHNLQFNYSKDRDYIVQLDNKLKFSDIMSANIESEYYNNKESDNLYDPVTTSSIFNNNNYSFRLDNISRDIFYSLGNPEKSENSNQEEGTVSVSSNSMKKDSTISTLYNRYKKARELEKYTSNRIAAMLSSYTRYESTHKVVIQPLDYNLLEDANYDLTSYESFDSLTPEKDFYSGDSIEKNFALITNNPEDEVAIGTVKDVTVAVSDLVNMKELARIWGSDKFLEGVTYFNSNYKKAYSQFFTSGLNGMFVMGDRPFNQGSTFGIPAVLAPTSRLISTDEENGIYKFQFERNVAGWPWDNNKYLMNLTIQQIRHDDSQKEILSGLGLYNHEWNPNNKEQAILINSNLFGSNKEEYINTIENIIAINDNNKVTHKKVDELLKYISELFPQSNQEFTSNYINQAVLNNSSVGITYVSGDYSLKIIFNK